MKKLLFITFSLYSIVVNAQTYASQNISLLSLIHPNTGSVGIGVDNRRYNSCWGWKQTSTNKEYAIIGASNGVYFADISNPASPTVCAFVSGKPGCTWREIKTYQNYCYVVSDDAAPNTFQIIDMSPLPATVSVVHNGTTYFERGHTIFIDGNKMYIGSTTYSNNTHQSMTVWSLATPTAPSFQRSLNSDYPFVSTVHDMYVNNDTVFASCGTQGLHIFRYTPSVQSFTQLGSYTNYAGSPYNHSSWMTTDRKHLVFCDEVPGALPIRLVNIQNFSNIQPVSTFQPYAGTTSHNPYVIDNSYAVIAAYQDGLNIYNIAAPGNPFLAGYFDTYPQGGANVNNYFGADYRGTWGAYPYLPSGVIIASDMQNGAFILDASAAYASNSIAEQHASSAQLILYPNPASDRFALHYNGSGTSSLTIRNLLGQIVYEKEYRGPLHEYIDTRELAEGAYLINLQSEQRLLTKKIIINH